MNETINWFESITAGDTVNAVAEKAGMVGSTLFRQIKSGTLSPESIVTVARAYDADPIEGLIIAGLLTEQDVKRHGAEALLSELTDEMIAHEVWARMQEGRAGEPITGGKPYLRAVDDDIKIAAKAPGYNAGEETDQ